MERAPCRRRTFASKYIKVYKSLVVRAGDDTAIEEDRSKSTFPTVGLSGARAREDAVRPIMAWHATKRKQELGFVYSWKRNRKKTTGNSGCDPCSVYPSNPHPIIRAGEAGSGQTFTCRGLWRKRMKETKKKNQRKKQNQEKKKGEPR